MRYRAAGPLGQHEWLANAQNGGRLMEERAERKRFTNDERPSAG